jgi:hypothetical protein
MKVMTMILLVSILLSMATSEDFEMELAKVYRVRMFPNDSRGERR